MWPGAVGDGEQSTQSAGSQPPITPEPSKGQGQVEDSDFRKDSKKLSIVFFKMSTKILSVGRNPDTLLIAKNFHLKKTEGK